MKKHRRRLKVADGGERIVGNGVFETAVVGESGYQAELAELIGSPRSSGYEVQMDAQLVLDDGNPHDPGAVGVEIRGVRVGFLARKDAAAYREDLLAAGLKGRSLTLVAQVRGGWRRKGAGGHDDVGRFGVFLDLY